MKTPIRRFRKDFPCPICDGYDAEPRGQGVRCYGFLSNDGEYAHCSTEEHARGLPLNTNANTYGHRLIGDCRCGVRHDPRPPSTNGNGPSSLGEIVATYDYRNEHNELVYQTVRTNPKGFFQRRPDGNGGWVNNIKGIKRLPYRLPELLSAIENGTREVYVGEGEKVVDALREMGFVATCNSEGAGKWRPEFAGYFKGLDVVTLPDNDDPGRKHAHHVVTSVRSVAASAKVVQLPGLPEKGDVVDWVTATNTADDLRTLVAQTQPFQLDPAQATALSLVRLIDLLSEPPEDVEYVWQDVLPSSGASILVAKPKVGKSTLAQNLAYAVASGQEFLGRGTAQGPVVYVALEDKRSELADHFRRLGATDESIFVHIGSAPEEALAALQLEVTTKGAVLAIIDPLFKLVRIRDGNDYAEVTRQMEPLLSLARTTGCHILCVHHAGKGDREGGDVILGSTALFAAVDTALILKRKDDRRVLESHQRYGVDIPKTVLDFDRDTYQLSSAGELEALEPKRAEDAILDALQVESMTQDEVRSIEGFRTSLLRNALSNLYESRRVQRSGAGRRNDPFVYQKLETVVPKTGQASEKPEDSEEPELTPVRRYGGPEENTGSGGSHMYTGTRKPETVEPQSAEVVSGQDEPWKADL